MHLYIKVKAFIAGICAQNSTNDGFWTLQVHIETFKNRQFFFFFCLPGAPFFVEVETIIDPLLSSCCLNLVSGSRHPFNCWALLKAWKWRYQDFFIENLPTKTFKNGPRFTSYSGTNDGSTSPGNFNENSFKIIKILWISWKNHMKTQKI